MTHLYHLALLATATSCLSMKKVDEISLILSIIQKASLILTPSLSQMTILHLLMILIIRLRVIAKCQNRIHQSSIIFLEDDGLLTLFWQYYRFQLLSHGLQIMVMVTYY